MKLSELRPCDVCAKKIAPIVYRIRLDFGMFNASAVNQGLGLMQYFNGSLALAEAMSPQPEVLRFMGDMDEKTVTTLLVCQECYMHKKLDLPMLQEQLNARTRRTDAATELADRTLRTDDESR